MHGVCVVRCIRGSGFWWVNPATGSKAALPTEARAWEDAWKELEGW